MQKKHSFIALVLASLAIPAVAQDQLHTFFSGATAGVGDIGGLTFDSAGNFWVAGRGPTTSAAIRKITNNAGTWTGETYVPNIDWTFYYRSADLPSGRTKPTWSGPIFGTPSSFLLNPAPLTITIPTGSGGTVSRTYLSDQQGTIGPTGQLARPDATKRLTRYDLRKIDAATSAQPDYNNASNNDGGPGTTVFGAFGNADWNDVFTQVISEEQVGTAAGDPAFSSNWARSFAWSSNGQRIYMVDITPNAGGIYRIDPTTTGSLSRIWVDTQSITDVGTRINTEPAIVPTSVRDFAPSNSAVGDQIIVEGSLTGGNEGGLNVFVDTGAASLGAPSVIFDEATFRSFAEYSGTSSPQYNSITRDGVGNLYFFESQTDGMFKYDTSGRLSKLVSEAELNKFQVAQGGAAFDIVLRMQTRPSTGPGFTVTEVIYQDDGLDTPVGVYDFKVGDFNRDNSVNAADFMQFSAALGLRGVPASDANQKFDLNGNSITTGGNSVVDWKDVKILQQFANIPNGDVNFDSALNFTDLDVMAANYYTVPGQTTETWATGDILSIDPNYAANAVDANLVNATDLNLVAQTWVGLGQPKVTSTQADAQGYTGQFRTDLLAAFAAVGGVPGDYNGNGTVDAADYTVWRDTQGATVTAGTGADGSNNGIIDAADYTFWQTRFGNTSASIAAAVSSAAVPEPAPLLSVAIAGALLAWRRSR
jgi:hypothetical protein